MIKKLNRKNGMNGIYNVNVTYNVSHMIDSMIEVSKIKIRESKGHITGGVDEWRERCVTGFTFGRESGHTTGAIEYLEKYSNVYLFVENDARRSAIVGGIKPPELAVANRILPATYSIECIRQCFAGVDRNIILIIDSVSDKKFERLIDNLTPVVGHIIAVCRIGS